MTEEVVKALNNYYEVEPGNGEDRNGYLRDHNIKTYLIKEENDVHKVSPISCFFLTGFS